MKNFSIEDGFVLEILDYLQGTDEEISREGEKVLKIVDHNGESHLKSRFDWYTSNVVRYIGLREDLKKAFAQEGDKKEISGKLLVELIEHMEDSRAILLWHSRVILERCRKDQNCLEQLEDEILRIEAGNGIQRELRRILKGDSEYLK
ncbi:hypothetical protein [Bacillus wiedmannii]|uniref:hypothetical protein n=1 Tax=Bacillus wiedmannii TaxID=1890302 RepID=UPI003D996479